MKLDPNAILSNPVTPEEASRTRTGIHDAAPPRENITVDERQFSTDSVGDVMERFKNYKEGIPDDPRLDEEERKAKEAAAREKEQEDVDKQTEDSSKSAKDEVVSEVPDKETEAEAEVKPAEEKKLPPTARPTKTQVANYTEEQLKDLDPALPAFIKKMDKSAAEYVVAQVKAAKELQNTYKAKEENYKQELAKAGRGDLPQQWYENPDAYILSPEFRKVNQALAEVQPLVDHYTSQIVALRNGATSYKDVVRDPQTGQTYAIDKPVTPETMAQIELDLQRRLMTASQLSTQYKTQATQLATNFRARHQDYQRQLQEVQNTYFPQYANEDVIKDNNDYKALLAAVPQHVPSSFVGRMYVEFIDMAKRLEQAEAKLANSSNVAKDKAKLQPTAKSVSASGSTGPAAPDDFSVYRRDLFEKLHQE